MDMGDSEKFGLEKSGDHLNHHTSGISADWQFSTLTMGQVTPMTSAPCPTSPMVDSFGPGLWSHPTNPQSSGFSDSNIQPGGPSTAGSIPVGKPVALSSRGMFLPAMPGIVSSSPSHFPVDSAFIERAARFSCFNGGGNIGGMMNPFGASESMPQYSNAFSGGLSASQAQKSELNLTEAPKDASVHVADHGSNSSSPMKSQRDKGSPHIGVSGSDYREPNFTEGGPEGSPDLGCTAGNSSPNDLGSRKRKRTNQDLELEPIQKGPQLSPENIKENAETKQRVEQSSSKPTGRQGKDSSEAPKEDCIHVRARRGQATNSHSLAERVRREKISERMKYLQDLVPGCSKVTGKAVMLDEIINYVQSLQRQVEFLSMKLAAVNPRLDFNIEGLISKDLLQSRIGSSSAVGFSSDMIHPQLHLSQQGFIQSGISGMVNPSDAIRRAMNAQLTAMNGYKEAAPQICNAWDDELHNVMQMNFGSNPPLNTQE